MNYYRQISNDSLIVLFWMSISGHKQTSGYLVSVFVKIKFTLNNEGKQPAEFQMHCKEINVRTKMTSKTATDLDGNIKFI